MSAQRSRVTCVPRDRDFQIGGAGVLGEPVEYVLRRVDSHDGLAPADALLAMGCRGAGVRLVPARRCAAIGRGSTAACVCQPPLYERRAVAHRMPESLLEPDYELVFDKTAAEPSEHAVGVGVAGGGHRCKLVDRRPTLAGEQFADRACAGKRRAERLFCNPIGKRVTGEGRDAGGAATGREDRVQKRTGLVGGASALAGVV